MNVRRTTLAVSLFAIFAASPTWADWASVSSNAPKWLVNGQPGKLVGATGSAVFVSGDSGKTWQSGGSAGFSSITALTAFNNQVWLGSTSQGAAYSADSGSNWSVTSSGMVHPLTKTVNYPVRAITGFGSTVVAGPFVSTDSGSTWKATTSGLPDDTTTCILGSCQKLPITASANTGSAILAVTDSGIFRTTDGVNWSASGMAGNKISAIVASGSTVYASVTSGTPGLYKSTNGGSSWSRLSTLSIAPTALALHPSKDVIYAGDASGVVSTSSDGGTTWTNISDSNLTGSVSALVVPASQPDTVVAATSTGTFLYTASVVPLPTLTIPEITRATRDTAIISEEIVITGLTKPEQISVSGGEYSVNGRAFTNVPGIIVNGARIRVKVQSSPNFETATSVTLTVGTRTAVFKVTTLKQVTINRVDDVLKVPNPNATVVNGILQVTGTPTEPLELKEKPTDSALVQLQQNNPVQIKVGGQVLTYTAQTGTSQLFVQPISTALSGLQVSSGTYSVQSSGSGVVPVGSSGSGTSTTVSTLTTSNTCQTNMTISRSGVQTSAFVESCTVTYATGSSSGGNGFVATSSTTVVYGGETAELNDTGALQKVRIGSLNGDKGLPGDPASLTTGLTVDPDTRVPLLSGNLQRLSSTSSLLDLIQTELNTQFGASGKVSYDATSGVVTYVVNGKTYRFIPVGSPLIQTGSGGNGFQAASAATSASGSFSLASQGIQITLAGTFGYFNDLNTSLKAFSPDAKIRLRSSGAFQISLLGTEYVCAPGTASTGGGATPVQTPGFQINNNGLITFTDSYGALQVLYPAFADSNVATGTTKAFDSAGSFTDNGDGTSTLVILGQSFRLKPEYALSSVPAAHSAESWWLDGTKIYLRYNDEGMAQGMTVN